MSGEIEMPEISAAGSVESGITLKPSPEAIARLRSHPRFPDALRHIAQFFTEHYKGNRVMNALITDRGRMGVSFVALHLYWSRRSDDPNSGLSVGRLKAVCVEQGWCSGGRAEALIAVMRLFGYVVRAESAQDRRLNLLVPTDKFISMQVERWRAQFVAMAMLCDNGRRAVEGFDWPEFAPALMRQLCDRMFLGVRLLHFAPRLSIFADRNAGWMILLSLMLSARPGDTMPPKGPISISISDLARRFGVSRPHVRKLIVDATSAGLIARAGNGGEDFVMMPALREDSEILYASQLLILTEFAMSALSEIGRATA